MSNSISQKFTTTSLLKFALPTTIMMIIMSCYTMVDGIFVSNFVGENAFSAINIVFPLCSIILAIGIMVSTGGNAIVAKVLGEGDTRKASEILSIIVLFGLVLSIIITTVAIIFAKDIIALLGSTPLLEKYCYDYLIVIAIFAPFSILQVFSQILFVTIGKPKLGLIATIVAGASNMILDYLFIAVFKLGVIGAALGTGISCFIAGTFFVIYFCIRRENGLCFRKPKWHKGILLKTCTNGSSELLTNLSSTVTTILFNLLILKFAGEAGVAAIGIIMYAQFLLMSAFLGYSQGVAPILSYAYGAKDTPQIKKVFKTSIIVIVVLSLSMFVVSFLGSDLIIGIFVMRDSSVFELAKNGFSIFSFSFIFMGINVFASSMFTAFSNGKISAIISFLRTFAFIFVFLLVLPMFLDIQGIWLAIPLAEFVTIFVSIFCFIKQKSKYNY